MELSETLHPESPFRDDLIKTEFKSRHEIDQLANDPEVIIREWPFQELEDYRYQISVNAINNYNELKFKYNLHLSLHPVVGKNKHGKKSFFIITDRIYGQDLKEVKWRGLKEEQIKIEELFCGLIKYFQDRYKEQEGFLGDICKAEQYIYGTKKGQEGKEIYLVDLDRRFSSKDSINQILADIGEDTKIVKDYFYLFLEILTLYETIITIENNFGSIFKLTREKLKDFISSIPEFDPNYHILEEIKTKMN